MKDLTPQLTDALFKRIEKFEGVSLSEARVSPSPTRSDCQHIQVFFTTDAKKPRIEKGQLPLFDAA